MHKILNNTNSPKIDVPFDAWALTGNDSSELVELILQAGESIPAHANPVDVLFFILNGNGKLSFDAQTFEMEKGDSIAVPKDIDRLWENTGHEDLHMLVIKSKYAT